MASFFNQLNVNLNLRTENVADTNRSKSGSWSSSSLSSDRQPSSGSSDFDVPNADLHLYENRVRDEYGRTPVEKRKRNDARDSTSSKGIKKKLPSMVIAQPNPFKKKKQSSRSVNNNNNKALTVIMPPPMSTAPQVIPPPTAITTTTTNGKASSSSQQSQKNTGNIADGEEWVPYTTSEDFTIYSKYGIDPLEREATCTNGDCFGCGLHSDKTPLKQTNYDLFVQRSVESGLSSADNVTRAEQIKRDYDKLILQPKKKLNSLLSLSSGNQHHDCNHGTSDRSYREKEGYLRTTSHTKSKNDDTNQQDDTHDAILEDQWDTVDVYNHIKRHTSNTIEEVQQIRSSLKRAMDVIERNSLFAQHVTKKNAFGEPKKRADENQFKIYLTLIDKWIALSKSRPDKMVPFYDPEKSISVGGSKSSGGSVGKGKASGQLFNISGHLLFGKEPTVSSGY